MSKTRIFLNRCLQWCPTKDHVTIDRPTFSRIQIPPISLRPSRAPLRAFISPVWRYPAIVVDMKFKSQCTRSLQKSVKSFCRFGHLDGYAIVTQARLRGMPKRFSLSACINYECYRSSTWFSTSTSLCSEYSDPTATICAKLESGKSS